MRWLTVGFRIDLPIEGGRLGAEFFAESRYRRIPVRYAEMNSAPFQASSCLA